MQLLDRVAISENFAFTRIGAFETFIYVTPTHPTALQVMSQSSNSTTAERHTANLKIEPNYPSHPVLSLQHHCSGLRTISKQSATPNSTR